MSEIRFYHLERQTLDQILPSLLGKALQGGHRIVVKTPHEAETERLNQHLWTYDPASFLPHGTAKEGSPEEHPVWLTHKEENPNGADVLILVQGAQSALLEGFSLICDLLDGRSPEAVAEGRARWKEYKAAGYDITYWQQSSQGGWEKKT